MNLSKDYLISLFTAKKLYDDFDSDSDVSEDDYIALVDDIISYDLQLRTKRLAEQNYEMMNRMIERGVFSSRRAKKRIIQLRSSVSELMKNDTSTEYLENMLNSCLARLAKYRKSKNTKLLSKFDQNLVDLFSEFCDIDEVSAHFG